MTVGFAKFEKGDIVISTIDGEMVYGPLKVLVVNYNPDQNGYMYVLDTLDGKTGGLAVAFEYELDLYEGFKKQKQVNDEAKEWLE